MKTIIVSILTTLFLTNISFAGDSRWTAEDEKNILSDIREEYDYKLNGLGKVDGAYPLCSDVLRLQKEEVETAFNFLTIDYAGIEEKISKFKDLQSKHQTIKDYIYVTDFDENGNIVYPSQGILEKNNALSEKPTYADNGGGCFGPESSLLQLVLWDSKNRLIKPFAMDTSINYIHEGDHVLSSTTAVTVDKRYQKSCWAQVGGKYTFDTASLKYDHLVRFQNMTDDLRNSSFLVTPMQAFLVKVAGKWDWMAADSLASANVEKFHRVYSFDRKYEDNPYAFANEGKDIARCVYNLYIPETYTMFVNGVLVHNLIVKD